MTKAEQVALRCKVEEWLNNGGRAELEAAHERAERTKAAFAESMCIHRSLFDKCMDF